MSSIVSPAHVVASLNWRYATKKFDPTKKISEELWNALEEVLILAPSSYGLQPWRFFVVTSPEVKTKLSAASYGQTQPSDASHTVVFAVRLNLGAEHVQKYIDRIAEVRGVPKESLAGYQKLMVENLKKSADRGELDTWQKHQVYIALGQFMTSAAVLGIDTCPMEGIDLAKYDEILGLTGTPFTTVVACPAGYRAADDKYAGRKKVRFAAHEVVIKV
jgi:nitroreductase